MSLDDWSSTVINLNEILVVCWLVIVVFFFSYKNFNFFDSQLKLNLFSQTEEVNCAWKMFQLPFEELNPETLSNQVMKYAKTVMQLEKGLPPNSVVPILKDKVEGMRHKVDFYN